MLGCIDHRCSHYRLRVSDYCRAAAERPERRHCRSFRRHGKPDRLWNPHRRHHADQSHDLGRDHLHDHFDYAVVFRSRHWRSMDRCWKARSRLRRRRRLQRRTPAPEPQPGDAESVIASSPRSKASGIRRLCCVHQWCALTSERPGFADAVLCCTRKAGPSLRSG